MTWSRSLFWMMPDGGIFPSVGSGMDLSSCGGRVGEVGPVELGVIEPLCDNARLKDGSEFVEPIVIAGEGCDSEAIVAAAEELGSMDSMVTFGEGFGSGEVMVK